VRHGSLFLACTLAAVSVAQGSTFVRFQMNVGIDYVDTFDVQLFDDVTPVTVENFMNYVRRGDYTNSLVHRRMAWGIWQGGGLYFNANGDLVEIPTDPPIVNESSRLNRRGTLAMARQTGLDTATSQWYFNFLDNPALDDPESPYCVFGRVIKGIILIDAIGSLQDYDRTDIHPWLTNVPLLIQHDQEAIPIVVIAISEISVQEGDANFDGTVNVQDLSVLATNWGTDTTDWAAGEFNGDNVVNIQDLSILATNWSGSAQGVPEPACASLLVLGLCVLRRHR